SHHLLSHFFFSSRRRHTRFSRDWSSDVCSSDLGKRQVAVCGSDYHEDTVFQRLANPTLNVLAWSASEKDILEAVEAGHSYFTFKIGRASCRGRVEVSVVHGSMEKHHSPYVNAMN